MPKNNESLLADMLDFTQYIAACASTSPYEGDMIEKIRDLQPRVKSAILAASGGVPAPALPTTLIDAIMALKTTCYEGNDSAAWDGYERGFKAAQKAVVALIAAAPELPEGNQQPQTGESK